MPKLILHCNYLKNAPPSHLANYVNYISTREGVEKVSSTTAALPATVKQKELIADILLKIEDADRMHEYYDYLQKPTRENASEFITQALLQSRVQLLCENYKIDSRNLKWYAAFHNESHHPHVHLVVYSTNPSEGYLSTKGIDIMRSTDAHDIFRQEFMSIYEKKTQQKELKSIKNMVIREAVWYGEGYLYTEDEGMEAAEQEQETSGENPESFYAGWTDTYKEARDYLYGTTETEPDEETAHALMQEEAGQGNAVAMADLGKMYAQGIFVKADHAKAQEWYGQALTAMLAVEGRTPGGNLGEQQTKTGQDVTSVKDSKATWKSGEKKLKFSYKEQREYETIEDDIAALEEKIEKLESEMIAVSTDFVKLYLEELAARIAEQ